MTSGKGLVLVIAVTSFSLGLLMLTVTGTGIRLLFSFLSACIIVVLTFLLLGPDGHAVGVRTRSGFQSTISKSVLVFSFALLTYSLLGIPGEQDLALAVAVEYVGMGYVVLRAVKFPFSSDPLAGTVLSVWVSISISPMFYTLALLLPLERDIALSSIYFSSILLVCVVSRQFRRTHQGFRGHKVHVGSLAGLLVSLAIVASMIGSVYPAMAYLPSLDVVRLFSTARLANVLPTFLQTNEVGFSFLLASSTVFSNGSAWFDITILSFFSVILVPAFYLFAREFLSEIDHRLAPTATVVWTAFSGLGWTYFEYLRLTSPSTPASSLLTQSGNASFWDVFYGQGPWLWLWFRPLTVGVAGLFVLMYLTRSGEISEKQRVLLVSMTIFALGVIHVPELVFFVCLSLVLLAIPKHLNLHMRPVLYGTSIGIVSVLAEQYVLSFAGVDFSVPSVLLVGLLLVSLLGAAFSKTLANRVSATPPPRTGAMLRHTLGLVSIFWVSLLVVWASDPTVFQAVQVPVTLGVPWLLYPLLLGTTGFLAIQGVYLALRNYGKHPIVVLVVMFGFAIAFGRLLTLYNSDVALSGYWERRIIPIAFAAAAPLCALVLVRLGNGFSRRRLLGALVIAVIVISGVSSTGLSLEYQTLGLSNRLTPVEISDVNALASLNPNSNLLTVSQESLLITRYTPFAWQVNNLRTILWSAKSPELVLSALDSSGRPTAIYLSPSDDQALVRNPSYQTGYIDSWLLPATTPFYSYQGSSIRLINATPPPTDMSSTVLIESNSTSASLLCAYDKVSRSGYSFTTASIDDMSMLSTAKTLVVTSQTEATEVQMLNRDLGFPSVAVDVANCSVPVTGLHIEGGTPNSHSKQNINSGSVAAFSGASISGNLKVSPKSFLLPLSQVSGIELRVDGEHTATSLGAALISSLSGDIHISAELGSIAPGYGFYSNMTLAEGNIEVSQSTPGTQAEVAVLETNGSAIPVRGSEIQIKFASARLMLRQPEVSIDGEVFYQQFYSFGSLYNKSPSVGSDRSLNGTTTFNLMYGDTFTLVSGFQFSGSSTPPAPKYPLNEWKLEEPAIALAMIGFVTFELAILVSRRGEPPLRKQF